MHWIDWLIAACPLLITACLIVWARRHVTSVSDFLTGGRVAGRYVLSVSAMEASQGVFGLLAVYEAYYQSGFAYSFWWALNTPVAIVMALTGYCAYRFRETRAMTLGQFLEIRYTRRFHVFAGVLQSISGVLNYGLFPAVSGRFFVYFCGLPTEISIFGLMFPTFAVIMAAYLAIATTLATTGGQLAIMVGDCVNGILTYPMYLCVVAFIVWKFSWFHDLAPALLERPPGHSLINPFDIAELRDFNIFYVFVGIFAGILNRMSWSGNQGFYSAGKTAHEQKMAGVLATWRTGFSMMMYILVPVVALAYFNSAKFQHGPEGAASARAEMAVKVVDEVLPGEKLASSREDINTFLDNGVITPALRDLLKKSTKTKANETAVGTAVKTDSLDSPISSEERLHIAQDAIRAVDPAASQMFGTIVRQMRVPMAVRYILPIGILGMFCAICITLLIATDASYQHSWGSIIMQDVILPLHGKPFPPRQHLLLLRGMIVFVAAFAFVFSLFFAQVDYILMFQAITGAIWLGGSGPCIVGGLYWKRGTTAGAWCALIVGSTLAVLSIVAQKYWVSGIYPWLVEQQMVEGVALWLQWASSPFEPIIKWRMTADRFPINSQELFAITMLVSVGLYLFVSLLTSRQPFNMERMLHRGKYRRDDEPIPHQRTGFASVFGKLIGIDNQYTRTDKVIAWSVFIWSFGWGFLVCFVAIGLWNLIHPWNNQQWSLWFYINNFIVAGIIGAISTVWFMIGGTNDLRRLFQDVAVKRQDVLDDGRVIGHVSADDLERHQK